MKAAQAGTAAEVPVRLEADPGGVSEAPVAMRAARHSRMGVAVGVLAVIALVAALYLARASLCTWGAIARVADVGTLPGTGMSPELPVEAGSQPMRPAIPAVLDKITAMPAINHGRYGNRGRYVSMSGCCVPRPALNNQRRVVRKPINAPAATATAITVHGLSCT